MRPQQVKGFQAGVYPDPDQEARRDFLPVFPVMKI
jgi:hypothetical protein